MKPTREELNVFENKLSKTIKIYCKKHDLSIADIERRVRDWNPEYVEFYHNDRFLFSARLVLIVEYSHND